MLGRMELEGSVVVITGAASGIGEGLARRFAAEGAAGLVLADLDGDGAARVADELGPVARAMACDVRDEAQIVETVRLAESAFGPVDLYCSNAGIATIGGADAPDADWAAMWDIHVMAHVFAARAVLPSMIERGRGHLLNTASAAGLLTQLGSAPYSVTKHAAVGFAEWLSITHGHQGITVSVLCPQGVRTRMTAPMGDDGGVVGIDGMLEPAEVAEVVVEALADGRFLVLPHPEVGDYFARKGQDYERWLGGMRRLQDRMGLSL
jgi:NAD(P)-dependent dehydrogenase (short-subunit alcohol dehydrogenase family)